MRVIKRTLQATGAKVIFQSSTPVPYNLTTNGRIQAYNAAAKAIMAEAPAAAFSDAYVPFTFPPLFVKWGKIDYVYLIATMPGRHSGDQVHEAKKMPRHCLILYCFRYGAVVAVCGKPPYNAPNYPAYALFYPSAPFCAMGKKSTLLYDSPLCRHGIVAVKFTKPRQIPRPFF